MNPLRDSPRQEMVDLLAAAGRERKLARGEILFHRGDTARAVFCVTRGRLRLDRHLADGRLVTVGLVSAPDLLAEAALFSDRYHCTATAETRCSISSVPTEEALRILEQDAAVARTLIRGLMGQVRELRARLELRNLRPASERLLRYLELQEDDDHAARDRPLAALAAELGLTPEALYRVVGRLEKEGRLTRRGRRLELVR